MFRLSLIRLFSYIALSCIILTACSSAGESARYKSQAEQFMDEGKLAEAVLTYRQALISDPDNADLLSGLGMALTAQGRDRSAARALNQAAIKKPDDASIKNAISKLITKPQDGISLSLAWIADSIVSEPIGAAVASGRVFVSYADGRLMAFEQASGQVLWDIKATAALVSPPAADSDQVWVGAEDGSIFVYAAASGQSMGRYLTNGAVYAAPALTADIAFCPSNDGTLYAINRADLSLVWKAVIGDAMHASPLASDQAVYVGSNDGRLYALNPSTGERIWKYGILTQGAVESIPAFADGKIFAGSGDGRIYALDPETGGEYWRFSTPDAIYAQPLTLDDQLIVASSGQKLASIRYLDGVLNWSLVFEHPITQTPVFLKDQLYLVTRDDPRLFAVDNQAGTLLGELDTGDWIAYGPLIADSNIILVGKDGAVFLYR